MILMEFRRSGKKNKLAKKQDALPPNIYLELADNGKHIGYYVDGLHDHSGNPIPKKTFTSAQALIRNLNSAKGWIRQVEIENSDKSFEIPPLPKCVREFSIKENSGKISYGFVIAGYPFLDENGKVIKITKRFTNMGLSMEEKYNDMIAFYEDLENGIIPQLKRKTYFRSH